MPSRPHRCRKNTIKAFADGLTWGIRGGLMGGVLDPWASGLESIADWGECSWVKHFLASCANILWARHAILLQEDCVTRTEYLCRRQGTFPSQCLSTREDEAGNKNATGKKGLMNKTIASHVRYNSLFISLPSSATRQQRDMTKFCVVYGTWRTTASFSVSIRKLNAVVVS